MFNQVSFASYLDNQLTSLVDYERIHSTQSISIYPSYIKSTLTIMCLVLFGLLYITIAIAGWWIWEQSLSTLIKRLSTPFSTGHEPFILLFGSAIALITLAALLISLALLSCNYAKRHS